MNIIKVSTKDPRKLVEEINEKIDLNQIRSWEVDDSRTRISHKGPQYLGHFFYEYNIDDPKGILEFVLHSSGDDFADSRAPQLLHRMLNSHFSTVIEIL